MGATEITKDNHSAALSGDLPVLIDFWASWCPSCKVIAPVIDSIADKYSEKYKVCKVNVDEQPELASEYSIRGIPTLVVMKNKKLTKRSSGAMSESAIIKMLEQ